MEKQVEDDILKYSTYLDRLGFSKDLLQKRVKIYDNAAKCITKVNNRNWFENIDVRVAGSRGEGMSNSMLSDFDVIMVQPAVKCYHSSSSLSYNDSEQYVSTFELVQQNVPHGYVKLRLRHKTDKVSNNYYRLSCRIDEAMTEKKYLKSKDTRFIAAIENDGEGLLKEGWLSSNYQHYRATGPAQPLQFPLPFETIHLSIDYVQAFVCEYPSFFDEWSKRVGKRVWPCSETVEKIRETSIFVVPVGLLGSEDEELQWRLSYTLAENLLVRSFNDAQIKAYAAMKMLVKDNLKNICDKIDSYLVKNLIFWVSEERMEILKSKNFYGILLATLEKMKECVESGHLPNYIIPSRNLLQNKLSENERKRIVSVLNEICIEGVNALQRSPLIKSMCTMSGEDIEKRLLFRNLTNEVVMAFFALTPENFDETEHRLHLAKSSEDFQELYFERVISNIRERNPNECFPLITSMKIDEIRRVLQTEFKEGHHEIWCN